MQAIANLLDQARWRLIKVEQSLDQSDQSWAFEREISLTHAATRRITTALELLAAQEKESEEHDAKRGSHIRQDATKCNSTR
ncbi:unnamed protein product [marine sediment metagenome]|uniref:Uncharacterized protein n=1 Tax=marine sediment metagenome TaxID=412755 RepID=X1QFR5_9ZZZZ